MLFSVSFTVSNEVKPGGVISPIVFCVYMDGLISKLKARQVGYWMAVYMPDQWVYADHFKW